MVGEKMRERFTVMRGHGEANPVREKEQEMKRSRKTRQVNLPSASATKEPSFLQRW